jgi:acetyl/propionyl-CoA carboxylase alpha subunit
MEKLLIANRGEIAVRVIRAARELGIRTVAIYSEADRASLHVAWADEAVCVGAPEPSASYLSIEKVVDAARQTGAVAIHPGYGFLSERAEFAEACESAGITFVGPPASAMRLLGAKIEAKQLAVSAGVPVTPGYFEPGATADDLLNASREIGFPVLLKASAGGGGRGMRVVPTEDEFLQAFAIASDEALKAFGDGAMMVEKLVSRPRHVEAQFIVDNAGTVAVLFERECSVQRRHQKLIEEAPFNGGQPALWERMRSAVVSLAQASGYRNAGTVEFLVDPESGEFYFMEVNARLQVEHPVTEMITGVDLVQWQLRVARGESLELRQPLMAGDRGAIQGHAIEARIVAEDPANGFLPSTGRILAWSEPKMPGVRVDSGYAVGLEVSRYYDSLLAKVIAHGETRSAALRKMEAALSDFHILGIKTNIEFLLEIVRHPDFRGGQFDTGFVGREFEGWQSSEDAPPELLQIAAHASQRGATQELPTLEQGAWSSADGFRLV